MFVLILYRNENDFPIIGPFKSADAAIKHLQSLPSPPPNGDWRLQKIRTPIETKKPQAKKKAVVRKKRK